MKQVIISFLIVTQISSCSQQKSTIVTGLEGKKMPSFNLLLMDSVTHLNTTNIAQGTPTVLFYFSPYCPYCKAQAKDIIKNINSVSNIRFYLLSNFPFPDVKKYYSALKKYSNITVTQDLDNFFGDYFHTPGVPFIAIYDKNKNLKKAFIGNVPTDIIRTVALE
jgi:thiol-disulfide isomerase/thioredoxin